jgi:hypothetical protein
MEIFRMFLTKIKFIFGVALFLLASTNLFAAGGTYELEIEIDKILLKKDLLEVIKEAEKSPENNLRNLYKRLILYRRAVNFEKMPQIIKQILQTAREDKSGFTGGDVIEEILKDELFQDVGTLRLYLQNSNYISEAVYKKLIAICVKDKTACDVGGFDNWLAQKVLENRNEEYYYGYWIDQRLLWRESFGIDNTDLLNQFAIDFRNDPGDLDKALRYLSRFNNPQTVAEIAEKFASKQACDYHVLGERLAANSIYTVLNENNSKARIQTGIQFLNKSLQIHFNEKDKELIYKYYLRMTSITPHIGNYEKQLRFWTKMRLAEIYRQNGEADKAQPIVEELAKMDKSDILSENVSYLAGAVQAASGARVIEKKILSEQVNRQNTVEYWHERTSYYRGRNELLLVLDAYQEGLKNFPAKLNENKFWGERLSLIESLARFSDDAFGKFAERAKDKDDDADLSEETKQKSELWKKTENFLRTEFQTTKTNPYYSYALIRIIDVSDFKDLLDEIFNRHFDQIVKIYREIPINGGDMYLVGEYLESETVSDANKEELLNQLFNIAQISNPEKTLKIISFLGENSDNFAARSIPVLVRNLGQIEERLKLKNLSFTEREDTEYLIDDYIPALFSACLKAKNWKAAEKFMQEKYDWSEDFSYNRHESLKSLSVTAAENGDFADSIRFWKIRANLNRRDLDMLSSLAKFSEVRGNLVEFYQTMRQKEPYSPIPEMALEILK